MNNYFASTQSHRLCHAKHSIPRFDALKTEINNYKSDYSDKICSDFRAWKCFYFQICHFFESLNTSLISWFLRYRGLNLRYGSKWIVYLAISTSKRRFTVPFVIFTLVIIFLIANCGLEICEGFTLLVMWMTWPPNVPRDNWVHRYWSHLLVRYRVPANTI